MRPDALDGLTGGVTEPVEGSAEVVGIVVRFGQVPVDVLERARQHVQPVSQPSSSARVTTSSPSFRPSSAARRRAS